MNQEAIARIANAVLYEGYLLYPYRSSAVKNQQRFNFGVLYPRDYCELQQGSDAWQNQTECLVAGDASRVDLKVRFLQMATREDVQIGDRQEGVERELTIALAEIDSLERQPLRHSFTFAAGLETDGAKRESVVAELELSASRVQNGLYRIRLSISNALPSNSTAISNRDDVLLHSLVSVHSILHVEGGEFVSLLDSAPEFCQAVAECRNVGTFPVLVGDHAQRDFLLSSPIILYDYPEIAPESPGDLFDGLEIDEILALRILTLTDDEKSEVRNGDARARAILERTELLPPEHFQKLHGALRGLKASVEVAS